MEPPAWPARLARGEFPRNSKETIAKNRANQIKTLINVKKFLILIPFDGFSVGYAEFNPRLLII